MASTLLLSETTWVGFLRDMSYGSFALGPTQRPGRSPTACGGETGEVFVLLGDAYRYNNRLASMLESGDSLRVDVADHLQLAPKIRCCESFL